MYLRDIVAKSFVIVQADWPLGKARELILASDPTHVIMHRIDSEESEDYYLFTKEEAIGKFRMMSEQEICYNAFDLNKYQSLDPLDAYANAETDKNQGIVMDNGQIIGFFDFTVQPQCPPRWAGSLFGEIEFKTESTYRSYRCKDHGRIPSEKIKWNSVEPHCPRCGLNLETSGGKKA